MALEGPSQRRWTTDGQPRYFELQDLKGQHTACFTGPSVGATEHRVSNNPVNLGPECVSIVTRNASICVDIDYLLFINNCPRAARPAHSRHE